MERNYGFTYKLNNKPADLVTEQDYEPITKVLNKKGQIIDLVYEKDSKNRIHIHGVVKFQNKTPLFSSMCLKGFHSHFEEIYDQAGWNKYIHKMDSQNINKIYMF